MTTKDTIRTSDRTKLKNQKNLILEHYKWSFNSEPYCNRCKKVFLLNELDINHLSYEVDSYRYGELVCRLCHIATENGSISSFDEQKHIAPQTVLVFQKFLSELMIISKLKDGRIVQRSRLRLRAEEEVNPLVLFSIFNKIN